MRAGLYPPDVEFDRFLPRRFRRVSGRYWTPLATIARVARWLDELGVRTVADIGSGPGKFCVAGALLSRCRFVGVEQREELVATASALARLYGVEDLVTFRHEQFGDVAPPAAEAYYLFNPFGENLFDWKEWLDDSVELSPRRFRRDLRVAWRWLETLPGGTYVITYNGIGSALPPSYARLRVARDLPCVLALWRQLPI
jgi:hypothetical protein